MKNTNCLQGLMCPKCGQQDRFYIDAITTITLLDDGVDEYEGAEYDGTHTAGCPRCGWNGTVADLNVPGFSVTFEVYSPLGLEMGEADRRGWWMPGEWLHDEYPGELAFEFDPEEYDLEEYKSMDDAIVEWAVRVLRTNGAIYPSQDPSDHAEWWSTEDAENYETGELLGKSFHLVGFRDEVVKEVNKCMNQ